MGEAPAVRRKRYWPVPIGLALPLLVVAVMAHHQGSFATLECATDPACFGSGAFLPPVFREQAGRMFCSDSTSVLRWSKAIETPTIVNATCPESMAVVQ
jgi:hypothetical protein